MGSLEVVMGAMLPDRDGSCSGTAVIERGPRVGELAGEGRVHGVARAGLLVDRTLAGE
jgi:hypothetical protein